MLHVLAPGAFGGLESVVRTLALGARGSAVDVQVAAVGPGADIAHPFLAPLAAAGIGVFPIRTGARAYLSERRAVAALCERLSPDVVHTHGYRADVLDAPVARRLGVPVVSTLHGFTGGDWKNRLYERLQRRAVRRCDAVVAVSRPLAQVLIGAGVPEQLISVVPNAWEAPQPALPREEARIALGIPEGALHVGWVGRLTPEKGADVFIDALAQLVDLPVVGSVVGEGPERAALAARKTSQALGAQLRWHRVVMDASRIFTAFDVFVLSSRTEGTPITLFEAMAAGAPVVATAVGGVPDVVSSREALLVPPDDPRALAAAIRLAVADRAAARTRARCARERLQRDFAVGPWVARYEAVYRSVLRGGGGGPR